MNKHTIKIDYEDVFNSLQGNYLLMLPDFTIVAANDAYLDTTKTTRTGILGRKLLEVLPSDPHDHDEAVTHRLISVLENVIKTKMPIRMEVIKYNIPKSQSDGKEFEIKYWIPQFSPLLENGEVKYILHNVYDVTEKHHADKVFLEQVEEIKEMNATLELEKSKAEILITDLKKFKLAVDNAFDKIFFTDPNGIIIYSNKATETITGYTNAEIIGKNAKDAWSRGLPESSHQDFWGTLIQEQGISIPEVQLQKKNGELYTVQVNCSPILDENGTILFCVAAERDITKEKEVDKAKTELVSLASHQLLTPLSIVRWYSEILLAGDVGDLNKDQKKYLEEISTGNKRMIDLVNFLLDVSKMDLGTFGIKPEPISITELILDVVNEQSLQIKSKKISLILDLEKDIPDISVDPKYIRMVVQNLMSNAIKYSFMEGLIHLKVRKDRDSKKIVIEVQDTGIGIPKNAHDKIFTKHFRAQNAIEKADTEGTGLGLYLAKSIIDHSQGKIWFESEVNSETTFYVELPE